MSKSILSEILKIKQFYFSSTSKTVQRMQGTTNMWDGTNILRIDICFLQVFLENYRLSMDHKCQNLSDVRDLEKNSVELK